MIVNNFFESSANQCSVSQSMRQCENESRNGRKDVRVSSIDQSRIARQTSITLSLKGSRTDATCRSATLSERSLK